MINEIIRGIFIRVIIIFSLVGVILEHKVRKREEDEL